MKLYTQTPHEPRMCPIDFWPKRQRSRLKCYCYPFSPIIMKLNLQTTHELRMCPINFGVKRSKVKVTCMDYLKQFMLHNCFPLTPIIMKFYTLTPNQSRMYPFILGSTGQRSKLQCMDYQNGLCPKIAIPLHLSLWNFTLRLLMSWGCALLILG